MDEGLCTLIIPFGIADRIGRGPSSRSSGKGPPDCGRRSFTFCQLKPGAAAAEALEMSSNELGSVGVD